MSINYTFPKVNADVPLYDFERDILRIRDLPSVVSWAEKNFRLTTSYANPGAFVSYPWQREPLEQILQKKRIILCGATQTGKSLLAEIMAAYVIDNMPMNVLFAYSKRDVVEQVFVERIKPMVQEIPAIAQYWSGSEKDLTKKYMYLRHIKMRVASAGVKDDIATFSAGLVYLSEVAKYEQKMGWHPVDAAEHRQEAYKDIGNQRLIIESSPRVVGDMLHQQMVASGVVIRKPHYPCPHCKKYQPLTVRNVRKTIESKDPDVIRDKNAAVYECTHCKKHIEQKDRVWMSENVLWASEKDKIRNGKIVKRVDKDTVCYRWNRYVSFSYTFAESLARFFQARRNGAAALQVYTNEDMAEFWETKSAQISEHFLSKKVLTGDDAYYQYEPQNIPSDVLVLTAGADTQDSGFYFVVRGYGPGMRTYLVRSGFVECEKDLSIDGKDPRQIAYERFRNAVYQMPYKRKDGVELGISMGLIDRGGHRADDVDYICEHMPEWYPYIGLTRVDIKKPIIERASGKQHYLGQSEMLSGEVGKLMKTSMFCLPRDVTDEYIEHMRNQYFEVITDSYGNQKTKWVKIVPHDYRACENYAFAAMRHEGIEQQLYRDDFVKRVQTQLKHGGKQGQKKKKPKRRSGYFEQMYEW